MRERERQTATKPRYYIRGIEITAQTGLGRFGAGGGLARDFEHHHHVVHLGLGRARWQGTQGHYPTTSTASLPVLARRFRADLHEVGRIEGRASWSTRASTSRSAPSRAGREQLRGSSPPFPHGRVHSRTLAMATGRPKIYIYIQTDRDKTPILYKSD